jgi:enoyl-CoA hydratase
MVSFVRCPDLRHLAGEVVRPINADMRIDDFLIAPEAVSADRRHPIGIVDLDACAPDATIAALPTFPLIGIGDPTHRLATRLDGLVESPISIAAILRSVARVPHAAHIVIDLLRSIEGLAPDCALPLESLTYGLLQGSAEHADWLAARRPISAAASAGNLHVRRRHDILNVTIDRPAARNAIDRELRDRLYEAFTLAAFDPEIATIRLRATGATFSIGADLAEFGTTRDPSVAHMIRMRTLPALPLLVCGDRLDVHVQGGCVGAGLEMAAFAGRLTAGADAWFQLPELAMGLIPGAGGCVSVPRRIGRQRAALLILSGRRISAATALRWGLIDAIVNEPPADDGGADEG